MLRMRMQTWEWGLLGKDLGECCSLQVRHGKASVLELGAFSNSAGRVHRHGVGLRWESWEHGRPKGGYRFVEL